VRPRALAIVLALASAGCLAYACIANQWLVNVTDVEHARGFGLRTGWACNRANGLVTGDACINSPNATIVDDVRTHSEPGMSAAFAPMGWATLGLLALAAAALVIAALIAVVGAHPRLPITPPTVALVSLMLALITGCIFVATKPGPPGWVGVGTTFWVFGAGAVLGIAGAQQLARVNRPPDPDLLADSMNPDQF
jgi:hypothetical protein